MRLWKLCYNKKADGFRDSRALSEHSTTRNGTGLNFRVRNESGCFPRPMTVGILLRFLGYLRVLVDWLDIPTHVFDWMWVAMSRTSSGTFSSQKPLNLTISFTDCIFWHILHYDSEDWAWHPKISPLRVF